MDMLGRVSTTLCVIALGILSWTPGTYMVRTNIFSGHQEHFLAHFLSALTISVMSARTSPPRIASWLVLYACVLELGQIYVPGRHPAILDFCASALGAMVGAAVALIVLRASRSIIRP